MQYNGKKKLLNDCQGLGTVIKILYIFFLKLEGVKFHRHTNSACYKKCLQKVMLCCLRVMEVRKRLILHLNTKIKVVEANEEDKLFVNQVVAKFNVCQTQVYDILKKSLS